MILNRYQFLIIVSTNPVAYQINGDHAISLRRPLDFITLLILSHHTKPIGGSNVVYNHGIIVRLIQEYTQIGSISCYPVIFIEWNTIPILSNYTRLYPVLKYAFSHYHTPFKLEAPTILVP